MYRTTPPHCPPPGDAIRPVSPGDLLPLLVAWSRDGAAPVYCGCSAPNQIEEAAQALAARGTSFLVMASPGGATVLYADGPLPVAVGSALQAGRLTRTPAYVREMTGLVAATTALFALGATPPPLALAGGAWADLASPPEH